MAVDLDALQAALAGLSDEDRRVTVAAIWTHEALPEVVSDAQCVAYREAADALAHALPPESDPGFEAAVAVWMCSPQGLLATAYDARADEWEESYDD